MCPTFLHVKVHTNSNTDEDTSNNYDKEYHESRVESKNHSETVKYMQIDDGKNVGMISQQNLRGLHSHITQMLMVIASRIQSKQKHN